MTIETLGIFQQGPPMDFHTIITTRSYANTGIFAAGEEKHAVACFSQFRPIRLISMLGAYKHV